jgi:aspartate aminotransferase-like enzyme
MVPHRSQEFEDLYLRTRGKAQPLFATQAQVFIVASSGTGLQEAAVRNLARKDVLSCINGAFSQRWLDVALTNAKQADRLEADWNRPIMPEMVADALSKKKYELLTLVHNETSTGVQNPIQEVAAVVHDVSPDTLICIDAVSSLAGVKIEMDAWGLDMVLTSSQKCLALLGGPSQQGLHPSHPCHVFDLCPGKTAGSHPEGRLGKPVRPAQHYGKACSKLGDCQWV